MISQWKTKSRFQFFDIEIKKSISIWIFSSRNKKNYFELILFFSKFFRSFKKSWLNSKNNLIFELIFYISKTKFFYIHYLKNTLEFWIFLMFHQKSKNCLQSKSFFNIRKVLETFKIFYKVREADFLISFCLSLFTISDRLCFYTNQYNPEFLLKYLENDNFHPKFRISIKFWIIRII